VPEYRVDPEGAARIARAFDATFAHWEIALPRKAEELKRVGLYPEGDINAYLRTEGPPDVGGDEPDRQQR
jgi:hypothetical protein